jgi:uncharacterized phiE125 gp8 family phage protein
MVTNVIFTPNDLSVIVTLAKAKKQLKIEPGFEDEDDLIQGYIDAAVAMAEDYIGGHIQEKDMIIQLTAFDNPLVFEAHPLQNVGSVKYWPLVGNTEVVMDAGDYSLTSVNSKVYNLRFKDEIPQFADRFDAVNITVKVGNATAKTPKPIIQAILLFIADMYERREDRGAVVSTAAMSLLRPYKKF